MGDRDAHVWDGVDVCEDGALSVFGDEDGSLKVGNVVAVLDAGDGVGYDGVVLFELCQAELERGGLDGEAWDGSVGEGEGGGVLLESRVNRACCLELESRADGGVELVDGGLCVFELLGPRVCGCEDDVDGKDGGGGKGEGVDLLVLGLLVDDDLVAVDDVALHRVGEDALDGEDAKLCGDLADQLGDAGRVAVGNHGADGGLERSVGG